MSLSYLLLQVVVVASDERGNVDMADLKKKAEEHKVRQRLGTALRQAISP